MARPKTRGERSSDKLNDIVDTLKKLLASTYVLAVQTQGMHWNVKGRDFPQLHDLFQKQYEELNKAIDEIAEHIRTYGDLAPASLKEYDRLSVVSNLPTDILDTGALLWGHVAITELAHHLGEITVNAINTQNLAADRISAHEKAAWMLSATLEN